MSKRVTALALLAASLLHSSVLAVTVLQYNLGSEAASAKYAPDPLNFVKSTSRTFVSADAGAAALGPAKSHRWADGAALSYNFPVSAGSYNVVLLFAEVFAASQAVGARIFDVSLQSKVVLPKFDVFAEAGAYKALKKPFKAVAVKGATGLQLDLNFVGPDNPMISGITISRVDGEDIVLASKGGGGPGSSADGKGTVTIGGTGGTAPGEVVGGTSPGTGETGDFNHQSHAVPGGPYSDIDFNGDGLVTFTLDGTLSHSHYFNPETAATGKVVKFSWKVAGKEIGTKSMLKKDFPVGTTPVSLTVTDQTGDAAEAIVDVEALASSSGGAYCYYYAGATALKPGVASNPKPEAAESNNDIDFANLASFDYAGKTAKTWAARCVTTINPAVAAKTVFGLKFTGGAALYVDGLLKFDEPVSATEKTGSAAVTLKAGAHDIEVIYYKSGASASLILSLDGVLAKPSQLMFSSKSVIPTIASISETTSQPSGGGDLNIMGAGFFNKVSVKVGAASPKVTVISSSEIVVPIPSQADAGAASVKVVVVNGAGTSNAVTLTYDATAKASVSWEETFLLNPSGGKYAIAQIAAVAVGPDGKYYFGSVGGAVHQVTAGKDLTVTKSCQSSLGKGRSILGLAFNPTSTAVTLYAATSTLYWKKTLGDDPKGWANGAVETLKPGCGCMCAGAKVVTGLPVSNRDHAVNAIAFLGGDLLISVGSITNAGHNTPGNKLGGEPDSPLSTAILLAKLSKGSAFDGDVTYDQYADAETSKQTGGLDVSVYAGGLRNCFGMVVTTGGQIWATDNGSNDGFGMASTSCDTEGPSIKTDDELNFIVKGKYYGLPNRNRKDGNCVFGGGVKPAALFDSSTDGRKFDVHFLWCSPFVVAQTTRPLTFIYFLFRSPLCASQLSNIQVTRFQAHSRVS